MSDWQHKEQVTENIKIWCEDLHFGSKVLVNLGLMAYLIVWKRQCKTFFVAIIALSLFFNTNRFIFDIFREDHGFFYEYGQYLSAST